jgi:hypothetical protein
MVCLLNSLLIDMFKLNNHRTEEDEIMKAPIELKIARIEDGYIA